MSSDALKDLLERVHTPGSARDWRHPVVEAKAWDRGAMEAAATKVQALSKTMMQSQDPRVEMAGRVLGELTDSLSGDSSSPKNLRKNVEKFIRMMGTSGPTPHGSGAGYDPRHSER